MAIFVLQHRPVGKSGKSACRPGFAAAHARYILRESAVSDVLGQVPEPYRLTRASVSAWLLDGERSDRANARVCDRLIVALPRELGPAGYAEVVREFAADLGLDRVSWVAAIHARGDDAENPHAHIIIRDRDAAAGKRVLMTSERGSTEVFREAWETAANRVLARHGHAERIDRRTLEAQGIDGPAQIHVGPEAYELRAQGLPAERLEQNEAIIAAQKIVRGLVQLEHALEDVQREIDAQGTDDQLVPIEIVQAELERIEEEARAAFGPEPQPPPSVDERIRAHPSFATIGADVIRAEWGARYQREFSDRQERYERQHTLWTAAESVLSAMGEISTSVEIIAAAGVRAISIALDRGQSFGDRFASIAAVVRETVAELGDRYHRAVDERERGLGEPEMIGAVSVWSDSPIAGLFDGIAGMWEVFVRRNAAGVIREGAIVQLQPDGTFVTIELDRTQLRTILGPEGLNRDDENDATATKRDRTRGGIER